MSRALPSFPYLFLSLTTSPPPPPPQIIFSLSLLSSRYSLSALPDFGEVETTRVTFYISFPVVLYFHYTVSIPHLPLSMSASPTDEILTSFRARYKIQYCSQGLMNMQLNATIESLQLVKSNKWKHVWQVRISS